MNKSIAITRKIPKQHPLSSLFPVSLNTLVNFPVVARKIVRPLELFVTFLALRC